VGSAIGDLEVAVELIGICEVETSMAGGSNFIIL